jgi:lysozyme family protein
VQRAAQTQGGAALCAEFLARRLSFMASLPTWRTFGLGWARRLCSLPYQSLTMTEGDQTHG